LRSDRAPVVLLGAFAGNIRLLDTFDPYVMTGQENSVYANENPNDR